MPHVRSKARREALADRFRDPNDPFKLVIVRDMWRTGFDAPSLATMYVDKPMRGHARGEGVGRALVQACLARARTAGVTRMVLSTQPTMRAAHRVYEDLGFTRETARDWQTASGRARWVYAVAL